ncbi:MAG: hypothetical protein R3C24_10960 [Cyanobacteriota/Melainabacteria group bacterium]
MVSVLFVVGDGFAQSIARRRHCAPGFDLFVVALTIAGGDFLLATVIGAAVIGGGAGCVDGFVVTFTITGGDGFVAVVRPAIGVGA